MPTPTRPRAIAGVTAALVPLLVAAGCATSPSIAAVRPLASPVSPAAAEVTTTKPNIIFVLTDDLAPNLVKYMPHVQALRRSGATFSNYFVVDSLCCPSRSAMLTGQFPHNNGVFTNTGDDGGYATFQRQGDEKHTFGTALQAAGYRTGFMGKYLNGYQPTTDPVPPGWNEWDVAGNGYPEFNYDLNQNGTVQHYGHQPKDYLTDVVSGKASSFIAGAAAAQQPFLLELATFAPHAPSTPAPRDKNTFPGLKAPRTKAYNKLPSDPPTWLEGRPALTKAQQTSIDKKFRLRVQSVQAVDDMVGRLTRELKAKGLADNTYVVFSSDNGFHMGEHRLTPGKQTAFDTDIHVPLVVSGPGVKAGSTISQLTSNIDLAPTFQTLGGAKVDARRVDGTSLVPLLRGKKPKTWRQAVLVEHHGPGTSAQDPDRQTRFSGNPPSYEAVRTAHATYVTYTRSGEREYYNLAKDPQELHNLADSASLATLTRMQKTVRALSTCAGQQACLEAAQVK